jgi:ribose/xylose/arabinose/galactoside ABC-type transport system permease subunit
MADVAKAAEFERSFKSRMLEDYGILLVVIAMALLLWAMQPEYFMTAQNITNIVRQIGMNALLALGLYIVIVTAGIDLSVGSVMALSIMLLAMADKAGVPWPLVLLIGPAVGTLIGMINGLGLTLLRLPHPSIMTLGTLNAVRGICNLVTDGRPVSGISDPVRFIGIADIPLPFGGDFAVIPVSAILLLVCYVGVAWFMKKVSLGRHIFAIGGNPQAARVSGINVDGVLVFVYAASGFFAGLAALVMAGRTGAGYPNLGIGAELDAIAAVIIGGASFFGGRGSVLGVFAGVLVMGLLRNGLNLLNISAFWQQTLIGFIIILAVWIDVLRRRSAAKS